MVSASISNIRAFWGFKEFDAIGPTFSGLVLEHLNWHWIFWISLPFLVLALVFGIAYMQNVSETTKPKIDVLSIILSTIGFGGIVFGFSNAGEGSGDGPARLLSCR